jgi:hypothetical protein
MKIVEDGLDFMTLSSQSRNTTNAPEEILRLKVFLQLNHNQPAQWAIVLVIKNESAGTPIASF